MLINFKEQVIDNFLIPAFTLSRGEIVIIHIPGGQFFQPVSAKIIDIVTGKTPNADIEIKTPLRYTEHIRDTPFISLLRPITVGRYLKKHANKNNALYKKIYDIDLIRPRTKINTLESTIKHKLIIYATLSWTNNIVFDFPGIGPVGAGEIYSYIKTVAQQGGAAILVDWSDEFKIDCTTFIAAKYTLNH